MVVDTDMVPDTMAVTVAVTDTVWDTTDTVWDTVATMVDTTVWDTVGTTDTDTTTARGLLMPNPLLKPHPRLILPLMLGTDTMAVDTDMADTDMADTGMAADTADTTVMANRFLNSNILPFF